MPGKEIKGRSKRVMYKGGSLKPVNKNKNPGLAKLPTKVRNKMGFMKKGGKVKKWLNFVQKEKQQQKENLKYIQAHMQTCTRQEFALEK